LGVAFALSSVPFFLSSYSLMPIIEYTPGLFDELQGMVGRVPANMNLSHRPFVDYYYATRPWCKLYLYVSDSGKVVGTLGRELLGFEHQCEGEIREISIRIGSNWFSLHPGVGGELTKFSAAANPNSFGMTLVVSRKALTVLQHYGWVPVPGVRGYFLNGPCALYPGKAWWKRGTNATIRLLGGKSISKFAGRIAADVRERLSVCEESSYSKDLLPRRSSFSFRFAPTVEYLDWRYNLSLTFVRYRLFRILGRGGTIGYVILNEAENHIMVAQCDGEDATALAYGILMAVVEAGSKDERPRTVFLSCCHAEMGRVFEQFGFRMKPWGGELPFAFRKVPPQLDVSATGTAQWLVNYDWCDNGLQAPFLDQA
jgi:hypothetical protein